MSLPREYLPTRRVDTSWLIQTSEQGEESDVTPLLPQGWHHWGENMSWFLTCSQPMKKRLQTYDVMAAIRVVLPAYLETVVMCLHSLSFAPEHWTGTFSVNSSLSTVLSQTVRVQWPVRPSHPDEALCNFITPCNVKLQLAIIHPFPPRTAQPLPSQYC